MVGPSLEALRRMDEANKELRERNEERLKAAKEAMGKLYLLHPENAMSRDKFRQIEQVTA